MRSTRELARRRQHFFESIVMAKLYERFGAGRRPSTNSSYRERALHEREERAGGRRRSKRRGRSGTSERRWRQRCRRRRHHQLVMRRRCRTCRGGGRRAAALALRSVTPRRRRRTTSGPLRCADAAGAAPARALRGRSRRSLLAQPRLAARRVLPWEKRPRSAVGGCGRKSEPRY